MLNPFKFNLHLTHISLGHLLSEKSLVRTTVAPATGKWWTTMRQGSPRLQRADPLSLRNRVFIFVFVCVFVIVIVSIFVSAFDSNNAARLARTAECKSSRSFYEKSIYLYLYPYLYLYLYLYLYVHFPLYFYLCLYLFLYLYLMTNNAAKLARTPESKAPSPLSLWEIKRSKDQKAASLWSTALM